MIPVIAAAISLAGTEAFSLKDGDRVLFYGDSITEQRLYTTYAETFVRTRYPNLKIDFIASGVGGDATWGGWTAASDERVRRDVKPENPTVITIMLGMNDGGYVPFDARIFGIFQEWYAKLLGWMKEAAPQARITLMDSPPYDDWAHPDTEFKGYSDTVRRFGEHVKNLAEERKLGFVSINTPVTDFVKWALEKDPKRAASIAPDAIHPGPEGQFIIATQVLNHWNVNPVVSDVEINFANSKVVQATKSKVSELKGFSWKQIDESLPYAVEAPFTLSQTYLGFHERWNRQIVKFRGLASGTYQLFIDGVMVKQADSAAWNQGVNLASAETPMLKQARKVAELVTLLSDARFTRWRQVEFLLKDLSTAKEAASALRKVEAELKERIQKATQPKTYEYKLQMVKT